MKITKLRKMVFAFCISIVLFSINFLNVFAEKIFRQIQILQLPSAKHN